MKKIFLAIILILLSISTADSKSYVDYDYNTSPAMTDTALGVTDPLSDPGWSFRNYLWSDIFALYLTQDYTFTGALDSSGASSNRTGPLTFTPTATLPTAVDGKTFIYTGATGFLTNSILSFYDDTTPVYVLGSEELPTLDGDYLAFDATTGKNVIKPAPTGDTPEDTAYDSSWDNNLKAASKNSLYDKIESITAGSFAFDTYPTYEDSAYVSGIARNSTTLAVYSADASKWLTVGLTDSLDPTPVTFVSAEMTVGTSIDVTLSETVTVTTDGTWTLTGSTTGSDTLTIDSILGSVVTLIPDTDTFVSTDILTLAYSGDGTTSPVITAFTGESVTNSIPASGDCLTETLNQEYDETGTVDQVLSARSRGQSFQTDASGEISSISVYIAVVTTAGTITVRWGRLGEQRIPCGGGPELTGAPPPDRCVCLQPGA